MNRLTGWLRREARRQARHSDLVSALLLGQGARYARYRLGFVVLRLLLRTALHALEVLFLSRVIPFEYLAPLLSYRALAALAITLHWGATESLRQRVREAVREQRPESATRAVESWLSASCSLAAVPLVWVVARIVRAGLDPASEGVSLFDAYALGCCLRFGFDAYARSYHAGVFALRRVYRPLPTLLLSDLLEVGIIVGGFDALGAWSIPLAMTCAGPLDAALTVYYARRAYPRARLRSPRLLPSASAVRTLEVNTLRRACVQSFANAGMQLDAWLLLVLVHVDPPRASALSFATIYYVLRPVLGLATHWVRSFYFDLSRIDVGALRAFRPYLMRLLRRVALACAVLGAALTLVLAQLLWPGFAIVSLLWLVPFFVARALFALAQLEAFSAQRYRDLLAVTALLAAGIGMLAWLAASGSAVLCGSSLALIVATAWLQLRGRGLSQSASAGPVLGLAEWLHALRAAGEVRLGVLHVSRSSARVSAVLQQLAALHGGVRFARHGRACVLLFATADAMPGRAQLVAAAGGALNRLWLSEPGSGAEALAFARAAGTLPAELDAALSVRPEDCDPDSLAREFRGAFPSGSLLDLVRGRGVLDRSALPRAALGAFLRQLVAASRQHEPRARLAVDLAVYAPAGQAQLVFVVPRACSGFAAFRARVRSASFHASYVDVKEPVGTPDALGVSAEAPRLTRS